MDVGLLVLLVVIVAFYVGGMVSAAKRDSDDFLWLIGFIIYGALLFLMPELMSLLAGIFALVVVGGVIIGLFRRKGSKGY